MAFKSMFIDIESLPKEKPALLFNPGDMVLTPFGHKMAIHQPHGHRLSDDKKHWINIYQCARLKSNGEVDKRQKLKSADQFLEVDLKKI